MRTFVRLPGLTVSRRRPDQGDDTSRAHQRAHPSALPRLPGVETEPGGIKPKAYADIIAVNGNPLDDFSAIERVMCLMKNGTVYTAP